MSLSTSRWRAAAALPALALLVGAAPRATKGIVYTFTMDATNEKGKGEMHMSGKGMLAGGNARIDFTDVNAPQMKQPGTPFVDGSYILYRGATKEYLIVNTKERQYAEMGMDQLMQATSAITQLIHMEMTNVHIDAERVQPDTTVDGYKTQHWRMTQQYHSKISMAFLHREGDVSSVSEYYFAPEFDQLINPYMSSGWSASSNFFNNPDYTTQIKAASAKMHRGVPVLMVGRTTNTDKKGKTETTTMTMHVTSLTRTELPASTFEVPAGYTKYEPAAQSPASQRQSSPQDTTQKTKKHGLFHIPR